MALPKFYEFYTPILEVLSGGDISAHRNAYNRSC